MHEVAAGTEPQRLHRAKGHLWCLLGRHEAAERTQSGETRIYLRGDCQPDDRVNAVRTNDHIRRLLRRSAAPADEGEFRLALVLIDFNAAVVQAQQLRRERSLEQRQQVGAVSNIAVRAVESLALVTHRLGEQHSAVLPAPKLPGGLEANG